MSLDDLKEIDWQHAQLSSIPTYILVSFAIVLVGVILLIVGILI